MYRKKEADICGPAKEEQSNNWRSKDEKQNVIKENFYHYYSSRWIVLNNGQKKRIK